MADLANTAPFGPSGPPSAAVERLAVAVAGSRDGRLLYAPTRPLTERGFAELLQVAEHHRLLGALAAVVDAGLLPVQDAQREGLAGRHARWLVHDMRLERTLARVATVAGHHGVELRVLKGVALARLVYSDPAWRVFSDVDVLVPSDLFDEAVRAITQELGGRPAVAELRRGFDREFGKDSTVRIDGLEVDLHRTFVTGPFGLTVDLPSLFEDSTPFQIGGVTYQALGTTGLFLHGCYQAALGDYPVRLGALRDLMLIHELLPVDDAEVLATAHRWSATAVVQRAARLATSFLGPEAAAGLRPLAACEVPHRETRLLRTYLTPARSYTRPLASLLVIPGIRARARYARALLAPSAEYLRSRRWTTWSHAGRAIRHLGPRSRTQP